jgi:hypothetical protein
MATIKKLKSHNHKSTLQHYFWVAFSKRKFAMQNISFRRQVLTHSTEKAFIMQ